MIKRISCLIFLSVAYLIFQVQLSQAENLTISKDGNLRSGPSTKHEIISKVTVGTEVTKLEQSGSWYKVKLLDEKVGWIHSSLVKSVGKADQETPSHAQLQERSQLIEDYLRGIMGSGLDLSGGLWGQVLIYQL